jgi:murein DD-endopeptidase MepM/ murein hydrolase activator NlpD
MARRLLVPIAIVGGAVALRALMGGRSSQGGGAIAGPAPKKIAGVPFAQGSSAPAWPILTSSPSKYVVSYVDVAGKTHGNAQRDFGSYRDDPDGDRHHVGVDLYGSDGDPVVAAEAGVVVKVRPTFNLGTGVLFLATNTGITLVYGEIEPYSWRDFGIEDGSRVARGQKIARVGCQRHEGNTCTSHMIHFETYRGKVTKNLQWPWSHSSPPAGVLNPTMYLLRAAAAAGAA